MIFFEVVNTSYLTDALLIVVEQYGVLMDVDEMPMHRIMALASAAVTKRDKKK